MSHIAVNFSVNGHEVFYTLTDDEGTSTGRMSVSEFAQWSKKRWSRKWLTSYSS